MTPSGIDASPGAAQPDRDVKPRLWPTGGGKRRPERRGGGSALRRCSGGPTNGERKPATVRVAGWRPNEGREVGKLSVRNLQLHQLPIKYAAFDENPIKSSLTARSYCLLDLRIDPSIKYPASKTC